MSPLLDQSINLWSLPKPLEEEGYRYVRIGEKVALEDPDLWSHINIFGKYFDLGPVDDGGFAQIREGKIYFGETVPTSVNIPRNIEEARRKTKEVAIGILGHERVG